MESLSYQYGFVAIFFKFFLEKKLQYLNFLSFRNNRNFVQEWIKRKQLPPKNTDESEKEAEKRKADELRQLMAQVVIMVFNY